jgi:O-6-methylguanine DNA methyltransferase
VPGGLLPQLKRELQEYFAGTRKQFTLPRARLGTTFQEAVWDALTSIPYGETLSYRMLAELVGRPAAARAVGNAVGANPFLILVPCHRIIRADGGLGGFSAGVDAKLILHRIEGIRTI